MSHINIINVIVHQKWFDIQLQWFRGMMKIVCYSSWICLSVPIAITCSVVPQQSEIVVSSPDCAHLKNVSGQLPIPSLFKYAECWHIVLCYLKLGVIEDCIPPCMCANDLLAKCTLIGYIYIYIYVWYKCIYAWSTIDCEWVVLVSILKEVNSSNMTQVERHVFQKCEK